MSLQDDIFGAIKCSCVDMNTNLVVHKPSANNVGHMGLRYRFDILPERWVSFDFQSEYVTFHMDRRDGGHMLALINYFKHSDEDCIAKIQVVVDYLKNGCA